MNKKALIKDLNEVYNLVSDHDITEAMEKLEFVISEVKQLHIPVVVQRGEQLPTECVENWDKTYYCKSELGRCKKCS